MRVHLAGWRFVLFALIGTAAIVLLASIGVPDPDRPTITSGRSTRIQTAAAALHDARATGNVRLALERLRPRLAQFRSEPALFRLQSVLVAELTAPNGEVPELHPAAALIDAEIRLALRARSHGGELDTRAYAHERSTPAAVVALLTEAEADEQIAIATEAFFAPLARHNPNGESAAHRPDEFAARVLAHLEQADELSAPDEELLLSVIRAFESQNRPRARLRWALRAFGLRPQSEEIARVLYNTYIAQRRTLAAFLVVGAALTQRPDSVELWSKRAEIARWHPKLLEHELEARNELLRFGDSREQRERIIEVLSGLGRPGEAVSHAEALAKDSNDRLALLRPVQLALAAGNTERALAMLDTRAAASNDAAWWHERMLEIAWQNLEEDRVLAELRWFRKHQPSAAADTELEYFLRRRGRNADLADLLEEQLNRDMDNRKLEREVLLLRAGLGQHEKARVLVRRQADRITDPQEFFYRLDSYRAMKLATLPVLAMRMARSPELTAELAPIVLGDLSPHLDDDAYEQVAIVIAKRYPKLEASRAFLFSRADRADGDPARAAAAEKLGRDHFDDPEYLTAWAKRASWAADLSGETHARERLVELNRDDMANRRVLANLYSAQNRQEDCADQWRYIASREGLGAQSTLRLIDALFAVGEIEEAMALLERRARLPNAHVKDQLAVAEQIFGKGQLDRAIRFYEVVLEKVPTQPLALLRLGQIRAWTNDPRGAMPFLEKRLAVSNENVPEIQFTLGECHWAVGHRRRGRRYHRIALATMLAEESRTVIRDLMVAKMLARLERYDEARPIFERVLVEQPRNVHVALDYADAMISIQDLKRARELVEDAKTWDPEMPRVLRMDGMLALQERRYEDAAHVLSGVLKRFGPNAATASELGRAQELAGDYRSARTSYETAAALQPANDDLTDALARLEDTLSDAYHAGMAIRSIGDDRAISGWLAASTLVDDGRFRLGAALGYQQFSGRAAAVDAGATIVRSNTTFLNLAGTWRFNRRSQLGLGVDFFPGANGNTPIGVWGGARLTGDDPIWTVRVRGWWNELFSNPAAAAGLGGRSSGLALDGDVALGTNFWAGAGTRYETLSLDIAGQSASDPRFIANATLGWRIIEGQTRVGDPHRVDSALMPGVVGPRLPKVQSDAERNALSVWVSASTYQLLGDAELTTLIPLGERFDYLTFSARYDRHVADHWGFMAEGYLGRELQEKDSVYGIAAGLGWRPRDSFELALVGAYGSALGRSNDEASFTARLGLTWRW